MMRSFVLLLTVALAQNAGATTLRGTLVNETTGGPGSARSVRVVDTAAGMDQIGTLLDVEGDFVIEDLPHRDTAPYLLQVQSGGVLYSQQIRLDQDEVVVTMSVYDSTDDLAGVAMSMYHVIFERHESKLEVMEFFEFTNEHDPPQAVWRPQGPITLQLPPEATEPFEVSVSTPTGMPLRQELLETDDVDVYTVAHALKPGNTRLVLRYTVPYDEESFAYASKLHHPAQRYSVMVSPPDVDVQSEMLTASDEPSPMEGYAVYTGGSLDTGDEVELTLSGGSVHAVDPHAGLSDEGGAPVQRSIERIDVRAHRFDGSAPRIVLMGGLAALLLLGITFGKPTHRVEFKSELDKLEEAFLEGSVDAKTFTERAKRLLR